MRGIIVGTSCRGEWGWLVGVMITSQLFRGDVHICPSPPANPSNQHTCINGLSEILEAAMYAGN